MSQSPPATVIVGAGPVADLVAIQSEAATRLTPSGRTSCDGPALAPLDRGDGRSTTTDLETLRVAGVGGSTKLLLATQDDALNLALGVLAQRALGTTWIVARVEDSGKEALFRQLGLVPVNPTRAVAAALLDELRATGGAGA